MGNSVIEVWGEFGVKVISEEQHLLKDNKPNRMESHHKNRFSQQIMLLKKPVLVPTNELEMK